MPLPIRCRGKKNTDMAEAEGEYFGSVKIGDRWWAIVLWDALEDPDLYKTECLSIEQTTWKNLRD